MDPIRECVLPRELKTQTPARKFPRDPRHPVGGRYGAGEAPTELSDLLGNHHGSS